MDFKPKTLISYAINVISWINFVGTAWRAGYPPDVTLDPLPAGRPDPERRNRYTLARELTVKNPDTSPLVNELAAPLVRYLSRKVSNREDANDLAQEALLRMHKFQQTGVLNNARAFLFRTADNLLIDQMRRARVYDQFLHSQVIPGQSDEQDDKCAPSAERTVSAEQELDRIYAALDAMPPKVRHAFLMHRSSDLSYPDIAREMGVSTSMVEKYIAQALRMLRHKLK